MKFSKLSSFDGYLNEVIKMKTSMLSNASRLIDRYMHSRLIEKKINGLDRLCS